MAVEVSTSSGYRRPMKRRNKLAEEDAGASTEAPGLYVKHIAFFAAAIKKQSQNSETDSNRFLYADFLAQLRDLNKQHAST